MRFFSSVDFRNIRSGITPTHRLLLTLAAGFLLLLIPDLATAQKSLSGRLQAGDIVFQKLPCGGLCDAIIATTPCANKRRFNHCGIIVQDSGKLFVVEAIGQAVQQTPLTRFISRDTSRQLFVGRAKGSPTLRKQYAQASLRYVGRPYDDPFLPGDSALYCSELVWEAFTQDGQKIFPLAPMTFKASGKTHPAWEAYYQSIQQPIPEGLPGINPCAIANSPKIRFFSIRK
ncbi:MAG: hypothetical protein EOP52_12865 [Sphingobacteriales bacterium]|nr:MAG: hypothetical protein EOP52_12865 [Sphingobacteriales bacterium]